jgi:hypothetical protein
VTASQEGGQQDAGGQGAWLDMSRYPDTDPDTVLSSDDHSLLTTSLAVDDAELPDAVWEHMLAVVTGADAGDGSDTDVEPDTGTGTDDPAVDTWAIDGDADPGPHDDDSAFDVGDDPAGHVDDAWDGGAG